MLIIKSWGKKKRERERLMAYIFWKRFSQFEMKEREMRREISLKLSDERV